MEPFSLTMCACGRQRPFRYRIQKRRFESKVDEPKEVININAGAFENDTIEPPDDGRPWQQHRESSSPQQYHQQQHHQQQQPFAIHDYQNGSDSIDYKHVLKFYQNGFSIETIILLSMFFICTIIYSSEYLVVCVYVRVMWLCVN